MKLGICSLLFLLPFVAWFQPTDGQRQVLPIRNDCSQIICANRCERCLNLFGTAQCVRDPSCNSLIRLNGCNGLSCAGPCQICVNGFNGPVCERRPNCGAGGIRRDRRIGGGSCGGIRCDRTCQFCDRRGSFTRCRTRGDAPGFCRRRGFIPSRRRGDRRRGRGRSQFCGSFGVCGRCEVCNGRRCQRIPGCLRGPGFGGRRRGVGGGRRRSNLRRFINGRGNRNRFRRRRFRDFIRI